MTNESTELCLCGSGIMYNQCCGLYHNSETCPATAEALMRSRFTAYALHNADYLRKTWDSGKCPDTIDFSRETAVWQRLDVLDTKKGGPQDDKGVVEFKAYYLQDGEECVLHEVSRFIKKEGHWLYLDGVIKSLGKIGATVNLGKNAPCPCGSGKKFKRCCGAAA
ncbi:YchJ family protein [Methylomicrobium sp. Wu6]|nr:YchJ family protein [Methylomicrobium sp. Wu6]